MSKRKSEKEKRGPKVMQEAACWLKSIITSISSIHIQHTIIPSEEPGYIHTTVPCTYPKIWIYSNSSPLIGPCHSVGPVVTAHLPRCDTSSAKVNTELSLQFKCVLPIESRRMIKINGTQKETERKAKSYGSRSRPSYLEKDTCALERFWHPCHQFVATLVKFDLAKWWEHQLAY